MSILQRGRRYAVSSVAFLFLASTGFTLAGPARLAFADTVKQGSAMGYSGCVPGITQFGGELFVHLDAMAIQAHEMLAHICAECLASFSYQAKHCVFSNFQNTANGVDGRAFA